MVRWWPRLHAPSSKCLKQTGNQLSHITKDQEVREVPGLSSTISEIQAGPFHGLKVDAAVPDITPISRGNNKGTILLGTLFLTIKEILPPNFPADCPLASLA